MLCFSGESEKVHEFCGEFEEENEISYWNYAD
jgi:hypothetical protein